MAKAQRIVFSFDDRSLDSLKKIQDDGNYPTMANAVRDSLQISRALQQQAEQGYREVIVRNPETGEERIVVIPNLYSEDK